MGRRTNGHQLAAHLTESMDIGNRSTRNILESTSYKVSETGLGQYSRISINVHLIRNFITQG